MITPQILEENDNYWVLYKPSGWFVHAPSDRRALKQYRDFILTTWFWRTLDQKAYPIHRLDFATEGVMIWAKDADSASKLNELHYNERLKKTYWAIARGFTPDVGLINLPLLSDSSPEAVPCLTEYKTLKQLELPAQINSSFSTSRYSWVEVTLKTGRWHQIRRHFNRVSYPLIGDREHGDSHHNRFFRDHLKIPGLLLKAQRLEFICPFTQTQRILIAPTTSRWNQIQTLFQTSKIQDQPPADI